MYILGISCFNHDSSAALLKDGKIVAAAEEERFTRKKHDSSFPVNAVKYCLQSQNITIRQVDYVGFYEKPLLRLQRILCQHLESFPKSMPEFLSSARNWPKENLLVKSYLKKMLEYDKDIFFIGHKMAYAASSFLVSRFNNAAIVLIDSAGEWATTAYGLGEGSSITFLKEIMYPHSIGLFYSAITSYLGFTPYNSEYKLMGLAAYGNTNKATNPYYKKLSQAIDIKQDGSFCLDMDYFSFHYAAGMYSKRLCCLLGGSARSPESKITSRHKHIAAAVQLIYEEAFFKILNQAYNETKRDNLVLAGACSLNSVANGKILGNTPFKKIWIQPAAGDSGAAIGAASYIYNSILGKKRRHAMNDAYLGPKSSAKSIKEFLDSNNISYTVFVSEKNLISKTARLIHDNKVVGWFQGRMEFGPRALGARSILANPLNPKAKSTLNSRVKHREKFRPFAPAVCEDDAVKYFICDKPVPVPSDFMLMVYPVRKEWQEAIQSVTHIDGSGRLQTVRRQCNRLFYELIKEFGRLSGMPMLINTSFNIRGEPIVCTVHDAYKCMMGTGIDALVIGKFLVYRKDNLNDEWDSARVTKD